MMETNGNSLHYCQTHFIESPCRVGKARKFLESLSNAPGERCANSAYAPTRCSVCGKPHRLTELDAGSDQEFLRVCDKCFRKQNH
jgi:hypothetical protein